MRRAPRSSLVSGQLYRNAAGIAVVLAVLAALASGDGPPAQQLPAAQTSLATVKAGPAPLKRSDQADSRAVAEPVSDVDDSPVVADQPDVAAPAPSANPVPQPAATVATGQARPTPAQLRQLIEDSRRRSGAPPGGD